MTTPQPLGPATGLNVVHFFCRANPNVDKAAVAKAVAQALDDGLQVVSAAIMGAKADICFMLLGENLWDVLLLSHVQAPWRQEQLVLTSL